MTRLAGRVALVTGASRGIGAAVAAALAGEGARVIRVARSLTESTTEHTHDIPSDLTDPSQVSRLGSRVVAQYGPPEIVVSNAGAFLLRPLENTGPAELETQLGVNLRAPFYLARAFLPAMRAGRAGDVHQCRERGRPHRVSRQRGLRRLKYGLRGLHETLVAEYRGSGVRLTLVSPGPTDTSMWDPVNPDAREGFVPRAGMLRPADVADAIVFVATRPARVQIDWLRLAPVEKATGHG